VLYQVPLLIISRYVETTQLDTTYGPISITFAHSMLLASKLWLPW